MPVRRAPYFFPCSPRPYRKTKTNQKIIKTVSRTATAPFDRLRVFLITRSTDSLLHPERSARAIGRAVLKIHAESGVIGFWIGNSLNIAKIFPVRPWRGFWFCRADDVPFQESAIKFLSYESSVSQALSVLYGLKTFFSGKKRAFAKYVDHVDDSRNISGTSRFLSGGIGGLTSQLCKSLSPRSGGRNVSLNAAVPSDIPGRNCQGGERVASMRELDCSPS